MNSKVTLILALIFAIGVVAVVLLNKQEENREEAEELAGKLLALEKEDILEIDLEPSGIHAIKDTTNDEWNIVAPLQTGGEKSSIDAIANMFGWAKMERSISSDTSEYDVFGLDPERGRMVLVHRSGRDTLYLGDKTPTGSYVFARKSGSPDVFTTTTSLQTYIEKTLFDLRDKKVLAFDKSDVRSFVLRNAHGEFALENEAGSWRLSEPMQYSADESQVNTILNRLNSARAAEFVDEDPADVANYGLAPPRVSLDLLLGENRARKSLKIGSAAETKYYARDDSRRPVFTVDSSFVNVLDVTLFKLRDKDVVDFMPSDVASFELSYADSTIRCEKDTSNAWVLVEPEGREAKSWKVTQIVSSVTDLDAEDFAAEDPASLARYGLDRPAVRSTFNLKNGSSIEFLVGDKKGEDRVYVKTGDRPTVLVVDDDVLEKLRPKLDDISDAVAPADTTASTAM